MLTAVVVLGVAASLVMLLSTDTRLLRLGVVCALWAAVLGAFAMMRYRRESVAERSKVRDMQTVYQLELEREVAARREYELGVEKKVRAEQHLDADELRALRAELAVLRESIQKLYEGRLPAEQAALGKEGRRELAGGRSSAVAEPAPAFRPPFASPSDPPVTAETSAVPAEEVRKAVRTPAPGPIPAPAPASSTNAPGRIPAPAPGPIAAPGPIPMPAPAPTAAPGPIPMPAAPIPMPAAPETTVEQRPSTDEAEAAPLPRRRRSRPSTGADEQARGDEPATGAHSTGRSVAEIMAGLAVESGRGSR